MPLPRAVAQSLGAFTVAVSAGALVAAAYPAWDPSPLFGGNLTPGGARLALGGASLALLLGGFHLVSRAPPEPERRTRSAPATVVAREVAVVPERAAAAREPLSPHEQAIADIDSEIKAITRQIGKARVMLGTGRLSEDGYLEYVRGLDAKRAELERARVKHELAGTYPRLR